MIYPNDLISAAFGPFEGKISNVKMLKRSSLSKRLQSVFKDIGRKNLFNNKVYIRLLYILSPYIGYVNIRKKRFNKSILKARIIVEYGFGRT